MLVAESHQQRRFVGRLERGEELCGALKAFCKEHDVLSGEVRAWGLLSGVELVPYDREARGYTTPRRLRSFFELLQLSGTVATRDGELVLQLHATLSRDNTDRGGSIELLGGLLTAAEVLTCELSLVSFDDVTLVREFDAAHGVYALSRGEPRASTGSFAPPASAPASRAALGAAAHSPVPPGATYHAVPAAPTPTPPPAAAMPRPAPAPPAAQVAPAPRPQPPREPEVVKTRKAVLTPPTITIPEGGPLRPRTPFGGGPAQVPDASAGHEAGHSPAAGEPSWADAMRLSQTLASTPERTVRPGDVLEHPKFGRCDVMRVDDGEERISVRIPAGRLVELGLEVLQLELLRTEGQRQFYKVTTPRR